MSEAAAPHPRSYQLELLELAKTRNIAVHLPTGSGKTLISALLVAHFADAVVAASRRGGPATRVVFLCPTKTLVEQQAGALRATVPLRVQKLTGDDGLDTWSQAQWAALLAEAEVLVATPQCIADALSKTFIQLRDVLLLVLDECHHAAKNHPMSQVMRFYAQLSESQRPRVLGLTASPLHGLGAPAKAIAQLEATLFCKVVTALDWGAVTHHSPCPASAVEPYDGPDADVAAAAAAAAHAGKGAALRARRVFAAVMPALGLWGAAAALQHALSREERSPYAVAAAMDIDDDGAMMVAPPQAQFATCHRNDKVAAAAQQTHADALAADIELASSQALGSEPVSDAVDSDAYEPRFRRAGRAIDAVLRCAPPAALLAMADAAVSHQHSASNTPWLSDKVAALLRVLLRYASAPPGWRAVVFCERRDTARALAALLSALASAPGSRFAFLRPGVQTGYAAASAGAAQRAVLAAFRAGACNCVLATAVLEEGVDVPECSLVVLFDLARNVKSFIQARGRARAAASALVVLAPRAGGAHAALLARVAAAEADMHAAATRRAAALAAGASDDEDEAAQEEALRRNAPGALHAEGPSDFVVPTTGARVALAAAVALVHQYTAKLPHDRYCEDWRPIFATTPCAGGGHACTLTLPAHTWLPPVASGPQPSKRAARAAAALAAIAALHAGGALSDRLVPTARAEEPTGEPPGVENAAEAAEDDAEADLAALRCGAKEPDVLAPGLDFSTLGCDEAAGALFGEWHVATLVPHGTHADAEAHPVKACRLALLTRRPLPALPLLRLRARGRPADCRAAPLGVMSLADAGREAALRRFLAWAHATWFAPFDCVGCLSPLAAPLAAGGAELDWPTLCADDAPWGPSPRAIGGAELVGCVAWTHHTGMPRAFYILRTRDDVTVDTPLGNGDDAATSLGEHYSTRHGIDPATLQGPWLEAASAPMQPRNLLPAALSAAGAASAAVAELQPLAPPEPMLLPSALCAASADASRCPAPLWRAMVALPAQLWRLRGLLLARELAAALLPDDDDADLSLMTILAEATTSGAAGEDINYQRLELLGDAYVKFAVSSWLFAARPRAHEGQLSAARAARVSNTALAAAARRAGLHRYLRARRFAAGRAPPANLGRKALADVLEAVLGAVLLARGHGAAAAVAAKLRVLPSASPPLDAYAAACSQLASETAPRVCDDSSLAALTRLEAILQYAFAGGVPCCGRAGRMALLDEALTHASVCAAAPAYQRLEFLGDAAIDLLATSSLFATASLSAGALTLLRSAAVNNARLGARAAALGIGRFVRHGSTALQRDMLAHVASPADTEAPKVLADVLEAVIGAVLLDSGLDLVVTWRVLRPLLALDDAALRGARNPVAALYEACAAARHSCALELATSADADNVDDAAPMTPTSPKRRRTPPSEVRVHAVVGGVVVASGSGQSRADARRKAAAAALDAWQDTLEAARAACLPGGAA